ncbi:3-keto-disaccharide hydrolase [Limnoglobus roseus]|uniref:Putative beta-jelly-roll-type glycoside hydrolase n=1 Tax=Limnoglobus roseus TaxID=2598579 RepID=A0A5C1AIQ8_9BACT|nr:DUF1080 domain-containing protein [Limnoglobus roseus]QEL17886.1 putative beta-jelly-roll-type glycoside hydrolase [Limnoglobus roseus]
MRCAIALLFVVSGSLVRAADDGFTPLFNGKDLTGWTTYLRPSKDIPNPDPKTTWQVADGVIRCNGKPNGYVMTEKEYSNYVLKVKWRYPAELKAGNTGVLLHCTGEDKVWPSSIEAQLRSGRAGDIWLNPGADGKLPTLSFDAGLKDANDKTDRHYFRIDKDKPVEKAFGEWNEYEITCRDGSITLAINGTKVIEGRNGSLKKGKIALQSEGTEVHFKDIAIKEMK